MCPTLAEFTSYLIATKICTVNTWFFFLHFFLRNVKRTKIAYKIQVFIWVACCLRHLSDKYLVKHLFLNIHTKMVISTFGILNWFFKLIHCCKKNKKYIIDYFLNLNFNSISNEIAKKRLKHSNFELHWKMFTTNKKLNIAEGEDDI